MCTLSSGKSVICRKGFSGIAGAIIGQIEDIDSMTVSGGVITAMAMKNATQAWAFNVEDETSRFGEVGNGNRPNGTYVVTQTLLLSNNDYETATVNTGMELSEGKYFAVIKYKNGKRRLAGVSVDKVTGQVDLDISGGLMMDTDTHDSGQAKEDKAGADWSLSAKENRKTLEISKTISDSLLDYVS
jgi:hypothetical protein